MIPEQNDNLSEKIEAVKDIILTEINVKDIEFLTDTKGIIVKKIKPNFKALGPKYGKLMKAISAAINGLTQEEIITFEKTGSYEINAAEQTITLSIDDVEILSEDIPGWLVATEGKLTVALDIKVTEELQKEGIAREFINRIQNLRKESGFDVTDKIEIIIQKHNAISDAITKHQNYIGTQTLARSITLVEKIENSNNGVKFVELDNDISTYMMIEKVN